MACPADKFRPSAAADDGLALWAPADLEPVSTAVPGPAAEPAVADPVSWPDAIEIGRIVPASGNMTVGPQQFWLGTSRIGQQLTFWIDTTTVHMSIGGWRIKTMPSRLSAVGLARLRNAGAHPAGPPPAGPAPGPLAASSYVEVQRLVNAAGILTLGNQVIQVGSPLAGQRARIRLDGQVMHVITQNGVLWRTLPCPIPPGQRHKLQGVRLAGPEPLPPQAQTVQRKVSSRGGIQVARQRIQVGFPHAGKIVTIDFGDTTLRVIDQHGELLTTVPRASTGEISRFKAYGRQPCRRAQSSNHTRYREGGDPMTGVTLNAADAAELAEMLQFLADWLKRDPDRRRASLEDFVHPAYNASQLQEDLDRFTFLLGGSDGNLSSAYRSDGCTQARLSPASRGYAGPSRRQRRSSSRCALRALHIDPAVAPALIGSHPGKPPDRLTRAQPWHRPPTQHLGDHRCSLPVASRIEQDLHGRQWQHGDPSATDDDSVHMVQVRSGDYHVARRAYGLYALQDLDIDAVDHGEGTADGAHVATIPAGLVAHHGAAQPVDQLGRGYVINQEIQVPRIDRQSMEGEGGASADSPPATSNNGQLAQGHTPRWC